MILIDWEKGAKGPQYPYAAANTEVVGRQLGFLLLHMINLGINPEKIHLIGFSLGAHVAGCASELVKTRGYLLGRITGKLEIILLKYYLQVHSVFMQV